MPDCLGFSWQQQVYYSSRQRSFWDAKDFRTVTSKSAYIIITIIVTASTLINITNLSAHDWARADVVVTSAGLPTLAAEVLQAKAFKRAYGNTTYNTAEFDCSWIANYITL